MSNVRALVPYLAMLSALTFPLVGLAVLGHVASRRGALGQYVALSIAGWLAATALLFLLNLTLTRVLPGEPTLSAFVTFGVACVPLFALLATILYCWGGKWSKQSHLLCALAVAALAIPLAPLFLLASTCFIQDNCL